MKRFLFMSALASVALASCVNDEAMENTSKASDQKITFNAPVVSGLTRAVAGEIGTTYSESESFKVFALWHKAAYSSWKAVNNESAVYMDKVTVSYTTADNDSYKIDRDAGNGSWTFQGGTGPYYWPKDGYLTFAAYSPADADALATYSMTETNGLQIDDFSVDADASKHYDLLYSELSKDQTRTAYTAEHDEYLGVDINFNHALSSIRFMVKTKETYSNAVITLQKIEIEGVKYKGDFTQDLAATPKTAMWTVENNLISAAYVSTNSDQVVNATATEPSNHNDIILMPQTLTDNDDAKITVTYTMQVNGGAVIPQTQTVKINTLSDKWEIGKRYTYNIIFTLEKVYFAPDVTDWVDVPKDI